MIKSRLDPAKFPTEEDRNTRAKTSCTWVGNISYYTCSTVPFELKYFIIFSLLRSLHLYSLKTKTFSLRTLVVRLSPLWCMRVSHSVKNTLMPCSFTWFNLVATCILSLTIVFINGELPSSGKCFCIIVWLSFWSSSHTWPITWESEFLCCLFMTLLMCSFALVDW